MPWRVAACSKQAHAASVVGQTGPGREQVPGVVVQDVDHPCLGVTSEVDPGGVDLPQVVGDLPLEPPGGLGALLRLVGHEVVATQRLVDRGCGRRGGPGPQQLGADPPRPPPGVVLAHPADLQLEVGVDLPRGEEGTTRSRLEALDPLHLVAALVLVEGVPGDLTPPAHLGDRVAGPLRFEQDLQSQFGHPQLPQSHARLPDRCGERVRPQLWGVRDVSGTFCPECVRTSQPKSAWFVCKWFAPRQALGRPASLQLPGELLAEGGGQAARSDELVRGLA
jgi:hypothetical protein